MERIIKILAHRNHHALARLLKSSHYKIESTDQYGSLLFSRVSFVEIYSPIDNYEKLLQLSDEDKGVILEAFLDIYPPKPHDIELTDVIFNLDPEAPIPDPIVEPHRLSQIDFDYIRDQITKSSDKINTGDFDGAITNARTLVENICLYILDKSGTPYDHDGDLPKLYKTVAKLLKMEPQSYPEKFFKEILSGCFSIVNGLSNIRNELGDAHGKSATKFYRPAKRHAVFAVEVAKAFSEFVYVSYIENIQSLGTAATKQNNDAGK
jgi:hypothetical protein